MADAFAGEWEEIWTEDDLKYHREGDGEPQQLFLAADGSATSFELQGKLEGSGGFNIAERFAGTWKFDAETGAMEINWSTAEQDDAFKGKFKVHRSFKAEEWPESPFAVPWKYPSMEAFETRYKRAQ